MNNFQLLRGVLSACLLGSGLCVCAGEVIQLEEIFRIAESQSLHFRPYLTAEEEADAEIRVAKSARLPEISANLSFSYIGDGFITKRDFSDYQKAPIPHFGNGLNVKVEQPLYTGGAITSCIKLAQQKSQAARFASELQRDNLRFQLTGFYLDIYKLANQRKVVESNLANAKGVLEEMRARHEQGAALLNDITRYELLVSNLELQLVKIANTQNILNNNLVTLAGLPAGTFIEPDSTILSKSLPRQDEQEWQQDARLNSSVLKLADTEVSLSSTALSLVKSERLPKIGLQAFWTLDGPILVEIPPIDRNLSYWYVGLGVSYNLSSLYKTNKKVEAGRLALKKATESLASARQDIEMGIHMDYVKYLEAYEELKTEQKSVELAQRNYKVVSTRFSEGMALITDMIDAANARLDAEQQLVNARIDIIYYYYKLLFTSGKL